MPGIAYKLLAVPPAVLGIVFSMGAVGLLGTGPVRINGGVIFFLFLLGAITRWLWREGTKREIQERKVRRSG